MTQEETSRPRVAAMERGPGPGRYGLPQTLGHKQHDPTKKRDPAYSFGSRLQEPDRGIPGPGYNIDPNVTRFGKEGNPKYTLKSRYNHGKIYVTPSPGHYNPGAVTIDKQRAPLYTIGMRTNLRRADKVPAPNSYMIPVALGKNQVQKKSAPCFTFKGRTQVYSHSYDLANTPGPAAYGAVDASVNKSAPAKYTIRGRADDPKARMNVPGPGSYSPEKVDVNKKSIPKFSMGIRHSEYTMPLIMDVVD